MLPIFRNDNNMLVFTINQIYKHTINDKQTQRIKMSYYKMQQTQQTLPSVKHKLPQPNSILPSQVLKSQPAHHIRKRVNDIHSLSSSNWPLDETSQTNRQQLALILSSYYGTNYDINELLLQKNKIAFLNTMVHLSQYQNDNYFFGSITNSLILPRKSIANHFISQLTRQLQFDDRIQSGNLYFALQHEPGVYLLASRLDYNTRSYGQWFYFRVTNVTNKKGLFKFIIINMTKNGTLFGKGLKISVCRNGVWTKQGKDIEYVPNKFIRKHNIQKINVFSQTYHSLTFTIQINSHQSLYVAYNQPYTYTKLGKKIDQLMAQNLNITRSMLCRTPLGNRIQMLSITRKQSIKQKKVIFITARAHPVQTAGSYVVDGIIQQLLKPKNPQFVNKFLENYIVKIIPMINPDGVIVGNSRCNIFGYDLNRQWKEPKKSTAPEILSLKKAILRHQGKVQMFLDLHGHSTKKSVFAYGCHDIRNPVASRQFPYLLSKLSEQNFNFNQCRFSVISQLKNTKKDGTARVTLWRKLKIPNIFTIQNSYCCAENSSVHYDSQSYAKIGRDIVMCLCSYFEQNNKSQMLINQQSLNSSTHSAHSIQYRRRQSILSQLRSDKSLINTNIKEYSEISSESELEDRVQLEPLQSQVKLNRNKSTKVYFKSKTQKMTKNHSKNNTNANIQFRQSINHPTLNTKHYNRQFNKQFQKQQDDVTHSACNLEQRLRKKYIKNLSPLNKYPISSKKYQGAQIRQQDIYESQKKTQIPNIMKQKPQKVRQNNVLSIVSIGLQAHIDSRCDHSDLAKVFSTKNIKYQPGIYQRMNTLTSNPTNTQSSKINKLLRSIVTPSDAETFSDSNQYRQPTLKLKKTGHKTTNKIQEFINKIAYQGKPNLQASYGKKNK